MPFFAPDVAAGPEPDMTGVSSKRVPLCVVTEAPGTMVLREGFCSSSVDEGDELGCKGSVLLYQFGASRYRFIPGPLKEGLRMVNQVPGMRVALPLAEEHYQ